MTTSENLPSTWQQKKDVILQLLELQHPAAMGILADPSNSQYLMDAFGLDDALFVREELGMIFAVHELVRCNEGLIFTVSSIRPADAWRDPSTLIEVFTAQVFGEE